MSSIVDGSGRNTEGYNVAVRSGTPTRRGAGREVLGLILIALLILALLLVRAWRAGARF